MELYAHIDVEVNICPREPPWQRKCTTILLRGEKLRFRFGYEDNVGQVVHMFQPVDPVQVELKSGKMDAIRVAITNSPIFPSADHKVITLLSVRINTRAVRYLVKDAPKLSPKVIGRDHICVRLTKWREGVLRFELERACLTEEQLQRIWDRAQTRIPVAIGIEVYEDRWKKYPARSGTADCDNFGNISTFQ